MNQVFPLFPWKELIEWYSHNGRHDLPWRDYTLEENLRAYRVWMSEIFLQQTQVERVRDYFTRIIEKYPTVHDLARASYEEFFPYYQGMGYYSRARNLLKTAEIISKDFEGKFPREKLLLQKLPGVGGYTSSAILAFAFGETYLAWDTNLEKVFARYYHGRKDEKLSPEEKEIIETDFRKFTLGGGKLGNENLVRAINNALMDFAATVDLKNPDAIDWENYPLKSGIWYETRGSLEPREVKKSVSFPLPDASVIVILHRDHKIYYAYGKASEYSPFVLPPSLTRDTRKYVQDYFREHYSLELSVRPPHKKWMSEDGKPYIAVNAQIQTGNHDFQIFQKKEMIFAKMSQIL